MGRVQWLSGFARVLQNNAHVLGPKLTVCVVHGRYVAEDSVCIDIIEENLLLQVQ